MDHRQASRLFADAGVRSDLKVLSAAALEGANFVIDRVLANFANPSGSPLPPGEKSIERLLSDRMKTLSVPVRGEAAKRAFARLQERGSRTAARYGPLSKVTAAELTQPAPALLRRNVAPAVRNAAARLGPRFADLARRGGVQPAFLSPPVHLLRQEEDGPAKPEFRRPGKAPQTQAGPVVLRAVDSLELFLTKVTCHRTTRGPGKDEISMAAKGHNLYTGEDTDATPFSLGKFKKGDAKTFGHKLASFEVPDNLAFDSVFLATVFFAETDLGKGLERYIESVGSVSSHEFYEIILCTAAFTGAMHMADANPEGLDNLPLAFAGGSGLLTAMTTGMVSGEFVVGLALVPVLVNALVGLLCTSIYDAARSLLGDEVFPPCLAHFHIEGPSAQAPALSTRRQTLLFALRQEKSTIDVVIPPPDSDPTVVKMAKADPNITALYEVEVEWRAHTSETKLTPKDLEPAKPLDNEEEALKALDDKIDHIVVVMLENRSFDHMLGFLARDRGRTEVDPLAVPNKPPEENKLGTATFTPQHYDNPQFLMDPAHRVERVGMQIWGPDVWTDWENEHVHDSDDRKEKIDDASEIELPDALDPQTAMSGFARDFARTVNGHRAHVDPGNSVDTSNPTALDRADVQPIMNYHPAEHVPVFDFLAAEFGVCSKWFCSFPGNTWVNRTLALTGRPAIRFFGQEPDGSKPLVVDNDMPVNEPSFVRVLEKKKIDWAWYAQDVPSVLTVDLSLASEVPEGRFRSMDRFFRDLEKDTFPAVSWIDPNFVDLGTLGSLPARLVGHKVTDWNTANDDHPPVDVIHGQNFIYEVFRALQQSKHWDSTLLIITYDEHGGFYDHVPPPKLAFDPEWPQSAFQWRGPRVPALVVSPHVGRQLVFAEAPPGPGGQRVVDHSSIIRTIFQRFCKESDGSVNYPSQRVRQAEHLGWMLSGNNLRFGPGEAKKRATRTKVTNRAMRSALGFRKERDKVRNQGVRREPNDFQKLLEKKRAHILARWKPE